MVGEGGAGAPLTPPPPDAHDCTGGPRNSRTFYLRIRLFAICKNTQKFKIHEFESYSLAYLQFLKLIFEEKHSHFFS